MQVVISVSPLYSLKQESLFLYSDAKNSDIVGLSQCTGLILAVKLKTWQKLQ